MRADINSRPLPGTIFWYHNMPTAIVVDGAFYLRRFKTRFPNFPSNDASAIAAGVRHLAGWHLAERRKHEARPAITDLVGYRPSETPAIYRIFFYDCPPLTKRLHYPVSKRSLNLAATSEAELRKAVHQELLRTRKVALRFGRLNDKLAGWKPKAEAVKRWLATDNFDPVDEDFELDIQQKGVDMKLGLDIAAMAFKRQVDQIILVAADADFVPAAKLARREGIDVVLDPLGANYADDLADHVDGIRNLPILTFAYKAED